MKNFLYTPEDFVKACEYAKSITVGDRTLLDLAESFGKDSAEVLHYINNFKPE